MDEVHLEVEAVHEEEVLADEVEVVEDEDEAVNLRLIHQLQQHETLKHEIIRILK